MKSSDSAPEDKHKLSKIELLEIVSKINEEIYSNEYLSDPDGDTIFLAKKYAKLHKIHFSEILSCMRPSGCLNRPVWNENGKIVPYKKMFGGYY
jgi:hypothetical protein